MNNSIIADSSGLVSLISEEDHNHQIAVRMTKELKGARGSIIVPSDVFSETLNVVGRKISHDTAIKVGQEIVESDTYLILEANETTRETAFRLFQRVAASVSFTDCVVMAFADQFNTKSIFGFDAAFHKNGYTRLGFDTLTSHDIG